MFLNLNKTFNLKLYCLIIENSFGSCFPNVEIVLKIYLTLIVTNCTGERSFTKLNRIKNEVRASMDQTRLNHLSLLSIEHELLREINTSRIDEEFSVAKFEEVLNFLWYYFISSPECSRDLWVILLHYLMHSEKVFIITFPSQILSLWDIQCFLWDLLFKK